MWGGARCLSSARVAQTRAPSRSLDEIVLPALMRSYQNVRATVVITTRNRVQELRSAIASALAQSGNPEVIVIDDGSSDRTADVVRQQFPSVRFVRSEHSLGYIVQRNRGARLASGEFVFSLDDDAIFSTPDVVAKTMQDFENERIGAVAIPYIEPHKTNRVLQQPPDNIDVWVTNTFVGTAHAVRREIFLALGGYRESLFHQGEESDFCVRMLAAGYVVRRGRSAIIEHYESSHRDFRRVDMYGRRNNLLFGWHNAPSLLLPLVLVATSLHGIRHGLRVRRVKPMVAGLFAGYCAIWRERANRAPVPWPVFVLYRDLVNRGAIPLEDILGRLPSPAKS
jgi:GT2 family glycosyltransferase